MRSVVLAAVLLAAVVSGCSADEPAPAQVEPLASGSASPAAPSDGSNGDNSGVSVSAAPAESEDATPSASPTKEQQATAFARQFFDVVNDAYVRRNAAELRRLSAPECGSCASVARDVDRLAAAGHVVTGRRYILSSAEAAPSRPDGQVVVDFRFDSDPYEERDGGGTLVQAFPADESRDGQILIDGSGDQWLVRAIRLVDQ